MDDVRQEDEAAEKVDDIPDIIAVIVNISLLQLNSGLEISSFDSYGNNQSNEFPTTRWWVST